VFKKFPASLFVSGNVINTDSCFKLLGINISNDLCRDALIDYVQKLHVDYICLKY